MKLYYTKIDKDWDELDEDDSVIFELPTKELEYRIYRYSGGSYFLIGRSCKTDAIFKKLDINGNSLAQSVLGYATPGLFPQVETLKDLKKVIKALDDECVKKFGMPKEPSYSKESKEVHPSELKEGDYIRISNSPNNTYIYIVKGYTGIRLLRYVSYNIDTKKVNLDIDSWENFKNTKITYATSEEKKLLDDALLQRGYIWDNINKKILEVSNLEVTSKIGIVDIPQKHFINDWVSIDRNFVWNPFRNYNVFRDITQEEPEKELNLFPTKKHYQLNFNY